MEMEGLPMRSPTLRWAPSMAMLTRQEQSLVTTRQSRRRHAIVQRNPMSVPGCQCCVCERDSMSPSSPPVTPCRALSLTLLLLLFTAWVVGPSLSGSRAGLALARPAPAPLESPLADNLSCKRSRGSCTPHAARWQISSHAKRPTPVLVVPIALTHSDHWSHLIAVVSCVLCLVCCVKRCKTPVCGFKNAPVCTGTTRTHVLACACGAGIHEDVLDGHTVTFWTDTRRFCMAATAPQLTKISPRGVITCFRGSPK